MKKKKKKGIAFVERMCTRLYPPMLIYHVNFFIDNWVYTADLSISLSLSVFLEKDLFIKQQSCRERLKEKRPLNCMDPC